MRGIIDHISAVSSDESDQSSDEYENEICNAVHLCSQKVSHNEKDYITNISGTSSSNSKVAVASSNGDLNVCILSGSFCDISEVTSNATHIVDLKFDKYNDNLLWSAIHNGSVDLWDLRTPNKAVSSFTDTSDDKTDKDKKFNSFDISSCGRLLCAGTNQFEDDSFILFWDIRKSKLAGGFWESHMDDVTQVKFHPSDSNKLYSGSTDGLINIFDLSQSSEEDSLIDTLNTELSIEKLSFSKLGSKNVLNCITHTSDIQFWIEEGVQPDLSFNRDQIAAYLKKKPENLHIVDAHQTKHSAFILIGYGSKSVIGMIVEKSSLIPSFKLFNNQQRLKCSWYNENVKILLTAGEKGFVDAWKIDNIL